MISVPRIALHTGLAPRASLTRNVVPVVTDAHLAGFNLESLSISSPPGEES